MCPNHCRSWSRINLWWVILLLKETISYLSLEMALLQLKNKVKIDFSKCNWILLRRDPTLPDLQLFWRLFWYFEIWRLLETHNCQIHHIQIHPHLKYLKIQLRLDCSKEIEMIRYESKWNIFKLWKLTGWSIRAAGIIIS